MKILTQLLKDGTMEIMDAPPPSIKKGALLIRTHYSVISAGTEGKTVKDARLGYIGKAKSRQKEVKQVIDAVKTQGISETYRMVMNKLEAPAPLGYSCSGEVIGVGEGVRGFRSGDLAACGGINANHAEIICVPQNLCVKIDNETDLKHAAFATVASIAIQGIRQADLRLGENCVVIGLGLIGQLTMQILNAGGIYPIGIDVDESQVDLANSTGVGRSYKRERDDLERIVNDLTRGYGTDAVIITAGTSSLDPVELAGVLCRKRGKVVIVGAVPTGFSREQYYKKELELRMSSSYGPGRYDNTYEEKGIDYPIGYVRWTENRNMQAYIDLLAAGKLNIDALITHEYDFEKAPSAYDMIIEKKERFTGVVLKYDINKEISKTIYKTNKIPGKSPEQNTGMRNISIGFIGAGNFAQNFLLPGIKNAGVSVELTGVATSRSHTSVNIADKYNFRYAVNDADEIINDRETNTVFIATRHNLHAEYVIKAIAAGKHVFVEKPLAMNEEELDKIKEEISVKENPPLLLVGYNRRFSPLITKLRQTLGNELPKAVNYRINAGALPADHWINDPETGGGRIIGEVCHFIDLCNFICDSRVRSVSAEVLESKPDLMDTLIINLKYQNGSVASISYFSNGNKRMSKEYLEVFSGGRSVVVKDFLEMVSYGTKEEKIRLRKQDKGHKAETDEFITAISKGKPSPISFDELYLSSYVTFKVIDSIRARSVINI